MVHREIENVRHWFWNVVLAAMFIGVVLLLSGCYQTDREWHAAMAKAYSPETLLICASNISGKPMKPLPKIVYKGGSWVHPEFGRIKGLTDHQTGTVYLAHRGDTETMAHEFVHWLGERDDAVAETAGRRCS